MFVINRAKAYTQHDAKNRPRQDCVPFLIKIKSVHLAVER